MPSRDEAQERLLAAIEKRDDAGIADALSMLQEHTSVPYALSSPILLGVSLFITKHPDEGARLKRAMRRADYKPKDLIAAVAFELHGERFGSPEECVEHVMEGADDVGDRVVRALEEIAGLND